MSLSGSAQCTGKMEESGNCDEGGLGYGLFWRRELNWKLLAWQWVGVDEDVMESRDEDLHA